MPSLQLPSKLERIAHTKARIVVLVGGRGSAKSESMARLMIMKAQTEQADILCGREYQTSIDDSVHKLLKALIVDLGVQGANILDQKIDFAGGGSFRYRGFARNSAAVKSAQGFKYSWIEEAQDLSEQSIEDLLPTIRAANSQLFFTGNPQASNDPFSQRFIVPFQGQLDKFGFYEDSMHLVIMLNYTDNPWFPPELEAQRLWDLENLPRAKYDHIWLGAYNDHVEDSIILAEWFDAAVDAHVKLGFEPRGAKVVSHDPSDMGADAKGLCMRHGAVILDVQERNDLDVNDGCDWATTYAIEHDADLFVWDGDGIGAGLRRQVAETFEGKKIEAVMFRGSEGVEHPNATYQPIEGEERTKIRTNKDTFKNKRAQYCWNLRDRFYNTYRAVEKGEYADPDTLISISSGISDMTQLRSETCRIPRKYNSNGLIQIMTKKEMMLKHKVASPNLFDALFMSLTPPPIAVTKEKKYRTVVKLRRAG